MDTSTVSTEIPASTVENNVRHYQDLAVGCGLAISGNLMISVSLNLQKYTHLKNEQRDVAIHYTRDPLWWIGVSLMVIGEIGNFSAYGYAPASLVAPLGTTTVIANMFLAAIFLKERIRAEALFGSALAVIGAILIVAFANKKEDVLDGEMLNDYLTQTSFIVYICLELTMLIVLFVLLYIYKMKRVVIYLLIVAIIASFSVISAKAVSSMLQLSVAGNSQMGYVSLYIMVIIMFSTAIIQVKYLNQAMKNFESTVVVPTNFVFFTISAILAGIVFYREFWGMSALEIFMFLFGCLMSFVGVYFIVGGRGSADSPPTEGGPPREEPSRAESILQQLIPSWLLATMNVGPVQPSGYVNHFVADDRRPFVSAEDNDSSSSLENLYTQPTEVISNSVNTTNLSNGKYGSSE